MDNDTNNSAVAGILSVIGSILGLVLIGFGIWALAGAIYIAWGLVRDPDSIAYFARYFLESTHVDALLGSGGEGLAHYLSWVAVILMLLVLGKLGAWAVAAGARLIPGLTRDR